MNTNGNGRNDPLLGGRIGKYDILELVGEGGMGKVYKAFEPTLNRWVAIKVLAEEFRNNSEVVKRFQKEAQLTSQLVHPNVVTILQYGQDEASGLLYIVSEFLFGKDLEEELALKQPNGKNKPLPPLEFERIGNIMSQVLSALSEAHRFGIIHRDIKPGNIFLLDNPKDFVKVLDFGLVKIVEDVGRFECQGMTQEGTTFGSPMYMSPEQVRGGKRIDHRTDIYSAGVVLYEMVAGRPPFMGETAQETMYKHVQESVPPPRDFRKDCPKRLEKVILKALEKDPDNRYAGAGVFAEDLKEALKPKRLLVVNDLLGRISGFLSSTEASKASDSISISIEFAPTISASSMEVKAKKVEAESVPVSAPTLKPRTSKRFYKVLRMTIAAVLLTVGIGFLLWLSKQHVSNVADVKTTKQTQAVSKPVSLPNVSVAPLEEWKLHLERGFALEEEKKWKDAEAEFRKAAELAPKEADVWKRLGETLLKQWKKKEAAEAYRKYLGLKPDAPDAPYIKALIKNW